VNLGEGKRVFFKKKRKKKGKEEKSAYRFPHTPVRAFSESLYKRKGMCGVIDLKRRSKTPMGGKIKKKRTKEKKNKKEKNQKENSTKEQDLLGQSLPVPNWMP
jgi:hypothetical protein